ncbi:MAG TPA: RdgB/HAM1 family non-canonical purine NTP pyrophosphatase [Pyrinomonadaceae bacterium]|jgi:XTP/dITP diphosphohydrolase
MTDLKLLVGTNNPGKIRELRELLADLPVELFGLKDFENVVEPEETGATFLENARLKADSYARQTGFWALSDDSGLEVEALGGAPGVYSARYAGAAASDAERIAKLLTELVETGDQRRRARFVCAMAIADEKGAIKFAAEGICEGKIAENPRGANGFGYDPIFVPDGFTETFGELSSTVKGEISHRARAIKKIMRYLHTFTAL